MKRRLSVLVVDDDAGMRLAMARVLERGGFEVTRCKDGREALAALKARPWDGMVTDVRMPGLTGQELLGQALALRPDTRIVLATAFGTVEDAVRAIRRGAADYLLKPFAPDALLAAVNRALDVADERARGGETDIHSGAPRQHRKKVVGENPCFRALLEQAARAARTDATILITGESGTGKEVVAHYIHDRSDRRRGPFVAVNCAALPADLLEAELFGVRKGAFTGADRDRAGHFERAAGGTLLLDEIGDCPLSVQPKLLRAIEEKSVVPLGSGSPIPIDIRVVAATHQDLVQAVSDGLFRRDLYFRLRVIPLEIAPLRSRREDIPALVLHMAEEVAQRVGRPEPAFRREAMKLLVAHPWPGNVRELRNIVERAVVLDSTGQIEPEDLFLDDWAAEPEQDRLTPGMTVAQAERRLIERTLDAAGGNRTHASRMLGISVRTLRNKLRTFREQAPASTL